MSNDQEERLVVLLEARIKDLERNMAKASGTTERRFREMSLHSRRATQQMEQDAVRSSNRINQAMAQAGTKIGDFGKAKIGGVIGAVVGAGIGGVIATVKEVADSVAEIGDQARMAGLSFKAFQEWKYVAEQARIPVDAITDGLKELQLRADEFAVTGKGSAAEAFQRLGLSPEEVRQRLANPSELLITLIERTRLLKDTAAGVRIFDELFGGTGGERMVSLIAQGEAGIRSQIKAAHDFGQVLSDDVILKAQEIDRQFNAISQTVGTTLKSAIVSAIASLSDFLDGLRTAENQRASTIQSRINDLMAEKQEVAKALASVDAADSRLNDRQKARAKGTHEIKMRQLEAEENALIKELESRPDVMNFTPKASDTWTPPPTPTPSASSTKRSASTDAAERERQAVQDLIAELEEELRLIDATDVERRASEASRMAGAAATDEERAKIIRLNEALYQEQEARQKAQEAIAFQKDALNGFISDLRNGASVGDAFANVLSRIADKMQTELVDALFDVNSAMGGGSGGWLSSLFGGIGSLFGGGNSGFASLPAVGPIPATRPFAKGGTFTNTVVDRPTLFPFAKGTGLMGEAGPEAIVPLSRDASGKLGVSMNGAQGGGAVQQTISINYSPTNDLRGASVEAVARLQQAMAQDRADLKARVVEAIREANNRGARFGKFR